MRSQPVGVLGPQKSFAHSRREHGRNRISVLAVSAIDGRIGPAHPARRQRRNTDTARNDAFCLLAPVRTLPLIPASDRCIP